MNQQQLENCITLCQDVKKIKWKEQLSFIMTHNFKDGDGELLELYTVKKHFKVEMEGDHDYVFDEVAKDDNEQPEEEVLPQVIDNEVMGVNDGGPQNDRIPSTTPGAEPPRDAKDSGSATLNAPGN